MNPVRPRVRDMGLTGLKDRKIEKRYIRKVVLREV